MKKEGAQWYQSQQEEMKRLKADRDGTRAFLRMENEELKRKLEVEMSRKRPVLPDYCSWKPRYSPQTANRAPRNGMEQDIINKSLELDWTDLMGICKEQMDQITRLKDRVAAERSSSLNISESIRAVLVPSLKKAGLITSTSHTPTGTFPSPPTSIVAATLPLTEERLAMCISSALNEFKGDGISQHAPCPISRILEHYTTISEHMKEEYDVSERAVRMSMAYQEEQWTSQLKEKELENENLKRQVAGVVDESEERSVRQELQEKATGLEKQVKWQAELIGRMIANSEYADHS